jgi:hypothetical protein
MEADIEDADLQEGALMRRRFLRTLAIVAVLQFFVTRQAAGNAIEEGRAERMWLLFPLNCVINAAMWTLVLTAIGGTMRLLRRAQ